MKKNRRGSTKSRFEVQFQPICLNAYPLFTPGPFSSAYPEHRSLPPKLSTPQCLHPQTIMWMSTIPAPSSYRGKFFAIATGQVAGQLHDQLNFCAPLFCGPNQLERWKMEHSGNPQDLPPRGYRQCGGRPPLDVDFVAFVTPF